MGISSLLSIDVKLLMFVIVIIQFLLKCVTVWNRLLRDLRECSSICDFTQVSKLINDTGTLNWLSMCDFFAIACLFTVTIVKCAVQCPLLSSLPL